MNIIALKLEPKLLSNPDVDLRHTLPELLVKRSGGVIQADGYDYVGPSRALLIYLKTGDLERAKACVSEVIANERVLDNDLRRAVTVAVWQGEKLEVIYPPGYRDEFLE